MRQPTRQPPTELGSTAGPIGYRPTAGTGQRPVSTRGRMVPRRGLYSGTVGAIRATLWPQRVETSTAEPAKSIRASVIIMTTTPASRASQDQAQPTVKLSTPKPAKASSQIVTV